MQKQKTLGDLLKALQKLSKEDLKKPLVYSSDEFSMSGPVIGFGKAKTNLYWNGDDDPSEIKSMSEWLEDGYEKQDVLEMEIAIQKGQFFIKF